MKALMVVAAIFVATLALPADAADLEDLSRQGYAVAATTRVDGEFNGCDFDKQYQFSNSLIFICQTYSYSYSYRPEVLILKNIRSADVKILIGGREYVGTLYRSR